MVPMLQLLEKMTMGPLIQEVAVADKVWQIFISLYFLCRASLVSCISFECTTTIVRCSPTDIFQNAPDPPTYEEGRSSKRRDRLAAPSLFFDWGAFSFPLSTFFSLEDFTPEPLSSNDHDG